MSRIKAAPPNGHGATASGMINLSAIPGSAIYSRWELVTKEVAEKYRSKNLPTNRRFMKSLSDRYARDMSTLNWVVTHEGIAFDVDDNLIDGQHRLNGIVEAGAEVWMLVTYGLPKEAAIVINRGKVRTLAHALQVLGYQHSDHRTIATARAMLLGPSQSRGGQYSLTDSELRAFIDRHYEAIVAATTICTNKSGPALLCAVLARAYYHADPAALARFVQAMNDSIPADEQTPADRTARKVKTIFQTGGYGSSYDRTSTYRKAQNGLRLYLDGQSIQKLYEREDDLFPLPTEENAGEPT